MILLKKTPLFLLTGLLVSLTSLCLAFSPNINKESTFDPKQLKIDESLYLGKKVPDITFRSGTNTIKLSEYMKGKPLILSLVYYTCPQTCHMLNQGLADSLRQINAELGKDYQVLSLSFDPRDNQSTAAHFRRNMVKKLDGKTPDNFNEWLFAFADKSTIKTMTDAVGFKFFYSDQDRAFVHSTVYVFIAPDGRVVRYIWGLFPPPFDLELAIKETSLGHSKISNVLDSVVLACYKYDSHLGGYRLFLSHIFASIGLFIALVTIIIAFFYRRKLAQKRKGDKK